MDNQKGKIINNVSATTAIDLKAELAQQLEQFEKVRSSSGKQITARKPDKKPTVWSRQNKGVDARNQKDAIQRLDVVEHNVLAKSREQLEKKARIYEDLRSGKYKNDDYNDEEKGPLIDFDRKYMQEQELENQKRDSEKKRKRKRQEEEEEDDPWVEYEDEFGRTRIVRRSELPKRSVTPEPYSDEEYAMDRPAYEMDDGLADRFNINHYEADREIRTKGVGFYGFSKDEDERQAQLSKLNQIRAETENARKSAASASDKRKQLLAKNAERIRARKALLQAKKHQLKPEQVPNIAPVVNEDSISSFLQSVRKQME
ncbi:hypothetical protein MFLAVUS_005246 [Mucor flavus]|uniref:CCDC174 alpha/beta GRSR domain-containing protein n=1 Tax=Mucor flavus TaxID=439312 RepID=A0ABP9YY62_9FUNG